MQESDKQCLNLSTISSFFASYGRSTVNESKAHSEVHSVGIFHDNVTESSPTMAFKSSTINDTENRRKWDKGRFIAKPINKMAKDAHKLVYPTKIT